MRTLNYLVILLILLLELSLQVLQDEQTTKRRHPAFVHLLSHEDIFLWWYLTPDSFLQLLGLEEIHPGEKGCSGISEWKRGEHQR